VADYVVVALPHTAETSGLIDAAALARMPRGAHLIHLSRGGIVDERALVAALESGHLRGAALDVFTTEPLPPDSPLWSAPNLLVTPHTAGYGERYLERCIEVLIDNVTRLEQSLPRQRLADRALGY